MKKKSFTKIFWINTESPNSSIGETLLDEFKRFALKNDGFEYQ